MKRALEIILFALITIMLLSSNAIDKNIISEVYLNSSNVTIDDTTNVKRFIEVDSFRLQIIPPSSGVQFYKDGIVFLSMTKNEMRMSSNQISFGAVEAYYASVVDSVLGKHMIFSPLSSFLYPCEAMTFSSDYNTIYFTKIPKNNKKEKIFMAKFVPDGKSKTGLVPQVVPLDFCADNYNYSHPTLSSDENILIFASDREGSFGGMDLYISRRTGDKWSVPENLGPFINTAGNEFFPFLDSENNLFFSSDRLPGYGGYDIFTSKFNGEGWDKPVNLSDHINTDKDDIAFTINKIDGKTAFFTRRQKSGKDNMQLFRVKLKQGVADMNLLTLSYVFDGKPVAKTIFASVTSETKAKPVEAESPKTIPATEVVKKEKPKVSETTTEIKKTAEKVIVAKPEPEVISPKNKPVATVTTKPAPVEQKDVVIYRVQLLPSTSEKKSKEIVINDKGYKLYEYLYLGAYRNTIGEFSTLAPAIALQRICRQSGRSQSFVVAFKNNIRSLDMNLFK
jgi:WD40-like Beta Propeller Repeat